MKLIMRRRRGKITRTVRKNLMTNLKNRRWNGLRKSQIPGNKLTKIYNLRKMNQLKKKMNQQKNILVLAGLR